MLTRALPLLALASGLALAAPAARAESGIDFSAMSEAERAAFGEQVRAYLLEHPEVIFDAIQILEERRNRVALEADATLISRHRDALVNDGWSPVLGNPDGDVTIVEFLDHRCGYCKRAHPEIEALLEQDGNIRLVLKEFPILGPASVASGRMAVAANQLDPEKYGALHGALMSFRGDLTEAAAYRLAVDAGYDAEELRSLAESGEVAKRVEENYDLASALGIEGTPSFVIGDRIVRGFVPASEMLATVEAVRAAD